MKNKLYISLLTIAGFGSAIGSVVEPIIAMPHSFDDKKAPDWQKIHDNDKPGMLGAVDTGSEVNHSDMVSSSYELFSNMLKRQSIKLDNYVNNLHNYVRNLQVDIEHAKSLEDVKEELDNRLKDIETTAAYIEVVKGSLVEFAQDLLERWTKEMNKENVPVYKGYTDLKDIYLPDSLTSIPKDF